MPRLSDTMEEGTVASWLKKVGDTVAEGDILAEIETDKATMEFESFHNGTLLYVGIQEGESAPVDSVLAIIGAKDADVKAAIASLGSKPAPVAETPKAEAAPAVAAKVETPKAVVTPVVAVKKANNGRIIASPLS